MRTEFYAKFAGAGPLQLCLLYAALRCAGAIEQRKRGLESSRLQHQRLTMGRNVDAHENAYEITQPLLLFS